jgi:hypothetical protein
MKRRLPKVAPTKWNSNSRIVLTVHEYRDTLLNFFQNIVGNPDDWDTETYPILPLVELWLLSTILILYFYYQFSTNYFLLLTLYLKYRKRKLLT